MLNGSKVEELHALMRDYFEEFRNNYAECAVLFSGGLDSSIVAFMASRVMAARAYAVGIEGSHDLKAAEEGALELGIPLVKITASSADVVEACGQLCSIFEDALERKPDRLELSIYSPMTLAMKHVREELVFTGQGADEAFGGYGRYRKMSVHERSAAMRDDLSALLTNGIDRDRAIAMRFGKKLSTPYLSEGITHFSRALDDSDRFMDGQNKFLLRKLALQMGLSAGTRAKKAMQYGSGFERVISKEKRNLERSGIFDLKRLH